MLVKLKLSNHFFLIYCLTKFLNFFDKKGTTYKIGTVPELLCKWNLDYSVFKINTFLKYFVYKKKDSASGGSFDWTHAIANIKHSYCLELRPGKI